MEEKIKDTGTNNRLTARQQRLVLRAVVGSLLISAALSAAPHAPAQTPPAEARKSNKALAFDARHAAAPFLRVLAKAAGYHRDGLINSDDTFEVTFEAERAPDGSLRNLNVTGVAAANGLWPDLMRELVAAVGESRLLASLEDVERLNLAFRLDDRRGASAVLSFKARTADDAAQWKSVYAMMLQLAAAQTQGRPEEALFRGANVSANGKQFALTLEMPREQLGNLLRQSLALP